jgi:ribosomal protein L17
MAGVEMKAEKDIDRLAQLEIERWKEDQERNKLKAERAQSQTMSDAVVTIVRIADLLGVEYEDAAGMYIRVLDAFSKAMDRKNKAN